MATYRKERVSDLLLGFIAEEVRKMRDPRLQLITITGVDISPDLKNAFIYWATHVESPTAKDKQAVTKALKGAAGFLRKRIGDELELRLVPNLMFKFDDSIDNGNRIETLLKQLS